jgi:hypothetical protein
LLDERLTVSLGSMATPPRMPSMRRPRALAEMTDKRQMEIDPRYGAVNDEKRRELLEAAR